MKNLCVFIMCTLSIAAYADSITISPGGVTIHGTGVGPIAAENMPRKVDTSGIIVTHPELAIKYTTKSWQITGAVLEDCFGHNAWFLMAGPRWKKGRLGYGVAAGIYARPTPVFIRTEVEDGVTQTVSYGFPEYPGQVTKNGIDYVPLIMGTADYTVPVTKRAGIEFNVGTNIILTHVNVGLKYSW